MNLLELSNIELRQICYFMAVTEAGNNFSKAAEYLHIEQPPLTKRIQSLEKKLKIELFDRKRRPIQLTPAGKVFLAEIQLTLASLDRAITTAQRAQRGINWLFIDRDCQFDLEHNVTRYLAKFLRSFSRSRIRIARTYCRSIDS
jgi:DNA-binding transcriptional LysR family regulator